MYIDHTVHSMAACDKEKIETSPNFKKNYMSGGNIFLRV